MTEEDIKAALVLASEARARADAATPGPWTLVGYGLLEVRSPFVTGFIAGVTLQGPKAGRTNADFIAAARSDVPALCDAIRRLSDELLAAWAAISDMKSESGMYTMGVRD